MPYTSVSAILSTHRCFKMLRATEKLTHGGVVAAWLILILASFGISTATDHPECEGVQCPLIDSISCPPDSNLRIFQLIFAINKENLTVANENGTVEVNNKKRRDLGTEIPPVEIKLSTAEATITSDAVTSEADLVTKLMETAVTQGPPQDSEVTSLSRCCPRAECVCKEICNIPSCHNTSLVLIETKPRTSIPGNCCAEYKCDFEPNCSETVNTQGSWLTDCQVCQCVAGQKICHRSCDEMRPPPTNCLSQNLKRSYSNGESWKEDVCTICECVNGEKKCLTSFCKALSCANKVKLSGECCPICIDPVTPIETTSMSTAGGISAATQRSVIVQPVPATVPPCNDPHERIVHVIEPNNEKCILYALIACLTVLTALFIGLYCHARSRQRSYRPVPIFDSNFNKIKSIVTS